MEFPGLPWSKPIEPVKPAPIPTYTRAAIPKEAVIASAPHLRDLQKELVHMRPATLERKKIEKSNL